MYALANMLLFLLLINYIAALISIQLLRGDIAASYSNNFGDLWNAFLAIYQVFSSENWTTVLYTAGGAEKSLGQTPVVVLFITSWLLFANCKSFSHCPRIVIHPFAHKVLLLQMFVAVINENFEVVEESKKEQQASNYWADHLPHRAHKRSKSWFRRLNPYRWFKANPVRVQVDNLPANLVLPMQQSVIQDYNVPRFDDRSSAVSY